MKKLVLPCGNNGSRIAPGEICFENGIGQLLCSARLFSNYELIDESHVSLNANAVSKLQQYIISPPTQDLLINSSTGACLMLSQFTIGNSIFFTVRGRRPDLEISIELAGSSLVALNAFLDQLNLEDSTSALTVPVFGL